MRCHPLQILWQVARSYQMTLASSSSSSSSEAKQDSKDLISALPNTVIHHISVAAVSHWVGGLGGLVLKVLSIAYSDWSDDILMGIFRGSPVLESLHFCYLYCFTNHLSNFFSCASILYIGSTDHLKIPITGYSLMWTSRSISWHRVVQFLYMIFKMASGFRAFRLDRMQEMVSLYTRFCQWLLLLRGPKDLRVPRIMMQDFI